MAEAIPQTDKKHRVTQPSRESPSLTSVGFLMHVARERLGQGIRTAIEGSGLHPGHLGVLGALTDAGPMNQRRLSELTLIDKSSMVLFLDGLEQGGWIRRVRDPGDRRAHIVEITDKGATRFAALGTKLKAVQDRFLEPLNEAERKQLTDLLRRLGAAPPMR